MERKYLTLTLIFASIAAISVIGFYSSYLSSFPDYGKFSLVIHIHFVAFLSWLAITIVQPLLIRSGNAALHRRIGNLAYVIAPVMVTTMALLVLGQARRLVGESMNAAAISSVIGVLDIVSFSAYFTLAMVNRRNLRWHVGFIVAATIIVLNPGMSRLFNHIKPGLGLPAAVIVPFLIPLCIIVYEKVKLNKAILRSPYALFFVCWAVEIAILVTVPGTEGWKGMVSWVAG